jgi:hypothetical protein
MTEKKSTRSKAKETVTSPEYKVVKSVASDSLNYVSTRFGEIVTKQMVDGWIPHGTPLVLIEDEKYIMIQAMIKMA